MTGGANALIVTCTSRKVNIDVEDEPPKPTIHSPTQCGAPQIPRYLRTKKKLCPKKGLERKVQRPRVKD